MTGGGVLSKTSLMYGTTVLEKLMAASVVAIFF